LASFVLVPSDGVFGRFMPHLVCLLPVVCFPANRLTTSEYCRHSDARKAVAPMTKWRLVYSDHVFEMPGEFVETRTPMTYYMCSEQTGSEQLCSGKS
jgi:hypothetical protein